MFTGPTLTHNHTDWQTARRGPSVAVASRARGALEGQEGQVRGDWKQQGALGAARFGGNPLLHTLSAAGRPQLEEMLPPPMAK